MQEYRLTSNDNKAAIAFSVAFPERNRPVGGLLVRILEECEYHDTSKANAVVKGLDWQGDGNCAAIAEGAEVMEVIAVLEGSEKNLRGGNGIKANPVKGDSLLHMKSSKDGVEFTITKKFTKTVDPEKPKKGKKGEKVEDAKPKLVTFEVKRTYTISKWEAQAIAQALRSSIQFIVFG